MTVTSTANKSGPYILNGVTTTFPRTFRIGPASDMKVIRILDGVESELVTGFTVTDTYEDTGNVIFSPALNGGELVLLRSLPMTQETDYSDQARVAPSQVEADLDKAVRLIQDMDERLDRAAVLPVNADPADTADLVRNIQRLGDSADNIDIVANIETEIGDVAGVAGFIPAVANVAGIISTIPGLVNEIVNETPYRSVFVGDGETTIVLPFIPRTLNTIEVTIGGLVQTPNEAYTLSGNTITFSDPLPPVDVQITGKVPQMNDGVPAAGVEMPTGQSLADRLNDIITAINGINHTAIEFFGGGTDKTLEENAIAAHDGMAALAAAGGGVLSFGAGTYLFGNSPDSAAYEVGGVTALGNTCGIVKLPNVSIQGIPGATVLDFPLETGGIYALSPLGSFIRGCEIRGGFTNETSVTNGRNGIVTVMPGGAGKTNLLAAAVVTDGWVASGDITLSDASGRLRATYGATGGGYIRKSVPTTIGKNYRLAVTNLAGTTPLNTLRVHMATGTTTGSRYYTQEVGFPNITNYRHTINFVATSSTTYIHYDCDATNAELIGDYFELARIELTDFPVAEQMLWVKDFWIEDNLIYNWSAYGLGIQDGDIINSGVRRNRIWHTGADAFDFKNRGAAKDSEGLVISNMHVSDFGLLADGQAGIDCHGKALVSDCTIVDYGRASIETVGLRFRTYGPVDVPYEGDQARGSVAHGVRIRANKLGETYGVSIGREDCHISGVYGEGGTYGISFIGNSYGNAARGKAIGCTWRDALSRNFETRAPEVKLIGCDSYDGDNFGFYNSGANVKLIGCDDTGSVTPTGFVNVPLLIGSLEDYTGGGTVTQATSKTTDVTINKMTGSIITDASNLAAGASVFFAVNNSFMRSVDLVTLGVRFPSNNYSVSVSATSTGSFSIRIKNETGGALAEAVTINFAIQRGGELA